MHRPFVSALTVFVLAVSALASMPAPAAAQSGVYTPKPGSLERKLILDTLRPAVESDLKRPLVFVVRDPAQDFRVRGDWAFVNAGFRQPSGAPLPARFFARYHGMFSDQADGLLHRVGGRWRLVTHNTGATDVSWTNWQRKYHVPPGLVPNQE